MTYEIQNTRGVVVRTTSHLGLAQAYVERMKALGSVFVIVRVKSQRRAA